MSEWYQIAVIGFIVLTIGAYMIRQARANPQDTGVLGKQIDGIGSRLAKVEGEVKRLDNDAASKGDVKRIERQLTILATEVAEIGKSAASREATLEHVRLQVDRLYNVIVNKGMGS